MAISVVEEFSAGGFEVREEEELRMRQYVIKSTAPYSDGVGGVDGKFQLAELLYAGTVPDIPRIGDKWVRNDGATGVSLNRPIYFQRGELSVQGFSVTHIGTVNADEAAYRVRVQYSTRPSIWIPKVRLEIGTTRRTVYFDLDAVESSPAQFPSPDEDPGIGSVPPPTGQQRCLSWVDIAYANGKFKPLPPGTVGNPRLQDMLINGENGVDADVGIVGLTFEAYIPVIPEEIVALESFAGSTNLTTRSPWFNEVDRYRFLGAVGDQIMVGTSLFTPPIAQFQFKFVSSNSFHREITPRYEMGTDKVALDENGLPQCRTSRVQGRKDWSFIWNLMGI